MNEELTKKLIEYLDGGKDFIIDQAPDIIQQTLSYAMFNSILMLIFFIICLSVCILILFLIDDEFKVFTFLVNMFFLFCVFYNIATIYKIAYAPKLYLIEKFITKPN